MTSKSQKQAEANIQTFLRIRPSKIPSGFFAPDDLEKDSLNVALPDNYKSDYINNSKLRYSFHFNGIINMDATQDEVFSRVGAAAVRNALDGFNSTIFAYGQTGSGKTFTLTGGPEKYSDRGIIPRSISMLFHEFRSRTDMQFKMYVSYLELYNEQGYDLLDPSQENKALEDLPKVTILEDEHGNFHLKNLSMHPAETEEEALNLLFLGDTNRAIAETPMNMASSRSHCIFSISLESRAVGSDKIRRSKLHLVDLAGSERVAKTNSSGSVLNEAKYINSSLFFLEMVIVALYEKATKGRTHVPYRNSMMTSVLRDSLGGNCKTIMIATMNPEAAHTEESLSTCRFAQRVSLIKNRATINEEMDPVQMIKRLKSEILNLREEISFLKGESGEGDALSPQEIEDLRTQCRQYCYDPDPAAMLNIGTLTLTKIKDVFAIMKNLVLEASHATGVNNNQCNSTGGFDSEEAEKMVKQIKDLKSLLIQRDSEINILVNMVKKGKNVEDSENISESAQVSVVSEESSKKNQSKHASKVEPAKLKPPTESKKEREEKIIKKHLFGIPPPNDPKVFEDASASFEWFRERCSLNASMNENKELLKDKIAEAKTMGERANQSRNTINYLKNSIESIRRDRALQRLQSNENGEELEETPEELTYRRAIEQEKIVYKDSLERLKVLKPEIEHIRKILEKCRTNMQNQFDQWYSSLHSKTGLMLQESEVQAAVSKNNAFYENDTKSEKSVHTIGQAVSSSLSTSSNLSSATKPIYSNNVQKIAESKFDDEMVNDDIEAFYQAKEELLKKKNGR